MNTQRWYHFADGESFQLGIRGTFLQCLGRLPLKETSNSVLLKKLYGENYAEPLSLFYGYRAGEGGWPEWAHGDSRVRNSILDFVEERVDQWNKMFRDFCRSLHKDLKVGDTVIRSNTFGWDSQDRTTQYQYTKGKVVTDRRDAHLCYEVKWENETTASYSLEDLVLFNDSPFTIPGVASPTPVPPTVESSESRCYPVSPNECFSPTVYLTLDDEDLPLVNVPTPKLTPIFLNP